MSEAIDSDIDICNLALDMLNANTIVSFNDGSKEAKQCNRYYAQARRATIRAHNWNFAMKRVALARSTTAPVFGYSYSYPLPVDCLRVFKTNIDNQQIKFKIERRNIVTDADSLKILYLFDNENPNEFDVLFIDALAGRLAAKLAYPITGDRAVASDMNNYYLARLAEARSMDAMEGRPDQIEADQWLNARQAGPDVEATFRNIEDATS